RSGLFNCMGFVERTAGPRDGGWGLIRSWREINPNSVQSTNNFFGLTLPGIYYRLSSIIALHSLPVPHRRLNRRWDYQPDKLPALSSLPRPHSFPRINQTIGSECMMQSFSQPAVI